MCVILCSFWVFLAFPGANRPSKHCFSDANLVFSIYNQWQNIMGILKSVFKIHPLPLYNVANR